MASPEITTNEIFAQDKLSLPHTITDITELFTELMDCKSKKKVISKYEWYDTNSLKVLSLFSISSLICTLLWSFALTIIFIPF